MDLARFGLRSRPFRNSPDVEGYYPATTHEAALDTLRRGLDDEEGLLLLRAAPGLGKTLLAHRLIESLTGTRTALLTHGSHRSRAELMQALLFDLNLPYEDMGEQALRLSLMESCLDHFEKVGRTIIIADEAHSLSAELLEELRLLSNLEGKGGRAVQVVLLALPRIADAIDSPGLETFRQRLWVNCTLEPWNLDESADYLMHQVRRCGGRPEELFGEDVLDILTHAAGGIPRQLNKAAHLALTLADENDSSQLDAEAAVEAVSRLGLDAAEESGQERPGVDLTELHEAGKGGPVALQMPRPDGPPVYVYGGGPETGITTVRPWNAAG